MIPLTFWANGGQQQYNNTTKAIAIRLRYADAALKILWSDISEIFNLSEPRSFSCQILDLNNFDKDSNDFWLEVWESNGFHGF